ncbi:MAG: hypothetical protein QME60_07825 [Verrucomicrobiota bacterium]|nr:hypothetical protein [Verrucomicrobiota bacterium]
MVEKSIRKEFDFFFAEGLSKSFGGVKAVDNFSIGVERPGDRRAHRPERGGQNDDL